MSKRTRIRLADGLSFKADIITELISLIAKRGSGKTYTATKLAEEMLIIGAQVVVLDPVGNWYGLRLGSNGKPDKGLDITVLGGRHGDIPLQYTAGKLVAKTIVETGMSVILDISQFSKAKQRRFVTDFSIALLEYRKQDPAAMHIFWEEAYRFMPQKITKGSSAEMLEATEELVTMGRNFGIGGTVICQRSAQVSKTVLTQASILIAMATTGLADRKTIEAWVEAWRLEMVDLKLSSLKKGEAYIWWPEVLGIKRVEVAKKRTFDASATPKFGQKTRKRKLRSVDLESLQEAMKETIEKMEAEDPRALHRRIAELERALVVAESKTPEVLEQFDPELLGFLETTSQQIEHLAQEIRKSIHKKERSKPKATSRTLPPFSSPLPKKTEEIRGGALRMLQALAALYPAGLSKKQIATAAKMKSSGGTFSTYWSKLYSLSLIKQEGSLWKITEIGLVYLGADAPPQPQNSSEKLEFWLQRIKGRPGEMLKFLWYHPESTFTKEEIGEEVGLVSTSGTFGTYLSILRSNNLITRDSSGRYGITLDYF